jgi:hypothetical protein
MAAFFALDLSECHEEITTKSNGVRHQRIIMSDTKVKKVKKRIMDILLALKAMLLAV